MGLMHNLQMSEQRFRKAIAPKGQSQGSHPSPSPFRAPVLSAPPPLPPNSNLSSADVRSA